MKKEKYYKFMWIMSVLFVLGFAIRLGIEYYKYDPITTSAPFYACIIIRTLEYLLPSIILFIVGIICKRKFTK